MGSKTSVYLPGGLAAAWKASGLSLTALIRAGLAAQGEPVPRPGAVPLETVRRVIREELAAFLPGGACAPGTAAQPARKPGTQAARPDPAADPPPAARECKHPGTARKARCRLCGRYNTG